MENIKFITQITNYVAKERVIIGDCVYYNLENGNKVKLWCYSSGVTAEVINKTLGTVDRVELPFSNYFAKVQCSPNSPICPAWTQHIENGKWYFEDQYRHVLPKLSDYLNLATAIETYIDMYA